MRGLSIFKWKCAKKKKMFSRTHPQQVFWGIFLSGEVFFVGETVHDRISVGKILHGGEPDFPALFKNRPEINLKKKVFQLKIRSNIDTQIKQKSLRIQVGLSPPQYLALYGTVS